MGLDRTVKNINRLGQVINILIKYGFEDIVTGSALRRFIPTRSQVSWIRGSKSVFEYSRWERIRMVIEELGPTFIKLGQVLSNRPDILPEALIVEFEKLQSDVPSFSTTIARSLLEQELGKPITDVFSYFDDVPIGSASIGQVHRARLKDGSDVVVKIQRPKARSKVRTDLSLLREFVKQTEAYFIRNGVLNPLEIVDTFERSMQKELDYTIEAKNLSLFQNVYKKEPYFNVPKPFVELCTTKILITEYISGCKINDIEQIKNWGLDPHQIAIKGINIYLRQIFEYGIFHADPHPGNVLVRPNGSIVLIDFGMVGKLTKQQKYAFAGVFVNLANQDPRGMAIYLRKLAADSEIEDMRTFEHDLDALIEDFVVLDVDGELGIADFTASLQKIIYKYKLQIPGVIFLILRALAILEGVGHQIYPELKTLEQIKPYGFKLITEQYSFKNMRSEVLYTGSQLVSMLYSLPIDIKYIFRNLKQGKTNLHIELHGHKPITRRMDIVSNKLSMTLLACATMLSSAIIMTAESSQAMPHVLGIPYASAMGFGLAATLSFWLFLYHKRNGNGEY